MFKNNWRAKDTKQLFTSIQKIDVGGFQHYCESTTTKLRRTADLHLSIQTNSSIFALLSLSTGALLAIGVKALLAMALVCGEYKEGN